MCQNFKSVICHNESMFPLCRRLFVFGDYSPAIFLINEDFPCSHIDHWFNGKTIPGTNSIPVPFFQNVLHPVLHETLCLLRVRRDHALLRIHFFSMFSMVCPMSPTKPNGFAASMPISKHSLATRTSFSF